MCARRCPSPPGRVKLVVVDISPEELALNTDVSETYIADVTSGIPVPTGSVNFILSRALTKHVSDVPAAIRHMARVRYKFVECHLGARRLAAYAVLKAVR